MRPILVLLIQTVGEERKRRRGRGGEGGEEERGEGGERHRLKGMWQG